MTSWLGGCEKGDRVKRVLEIKRSQKARRRWRILVSPINRCGQLLQAHHIQCQLSALASWKVSAEGICARGVTSLLLARVVVCLVPQCKHFRESRETTAAQELLTLCVARSKKILSSGVGRTYNVRGQCASSRNSSFFHEHCSCTVSFFGRSSADP